MAKVNLVDKRAKLDLWDTVKYQFITHCYLNKIVLSDSELDCLTFLAVNGDYDLAEFCEHAATDKIFKTTQSVRNCIVKMNKAGFIKKEGKSKKKIFINPDLKIQAEGNIMLDFKFVHLGTQEA